MSYEAWGDGDEFQIPEGYVTDEMADERVKDAVAEAAGKIPTNWLDPLLTGPDAALKGTGPWDCQDIERLLQAVKKRLEPQSHRQESK